MSYLSKKIGDAVCNGCSCEPLTIDSMLEAAKEVGGTRTPSGIGVANDVERCGKEGHGPDGKDHKCILPVGHTSRCKCDCGAKGPKRVLKLARWKRGRKVVEA